MDKGYVVTYIFSRSFTFANTQYDQIQIEFVNIYTNAFACLHFFVYYYLRMQILSCLFNPNKYPVRCPVSIYYFTYLRKPITYNNFQ